MTRDTRVSPAPVELVGVLRRQVPVRVLNVSLSGVLLEAPAMVAVGSACELRIDVNDKTFVDDIKVVRCTPLHGKGAAYQVGAQFLWTTRTGPDSIRRLAVSVRMGRVQDCGGR